MRVGDATAEVPRRCMAVVRGRLQGTKLGDGDAAAAQAACLAACKRAPELVATMVPYQLTHAECEVRQDGDAVEVVVTLQAYARARLSAAGQVAASAALACLVDRQGAPDGATFQVETIQDVQD